MAKRIMKSKNLIELEERLADYKAHHQNKGAQRAHRMMLADLLTDRAVTDDYRQGVSDCMEIIRHNFIK